MTLSTASPNAWYAIVFFSALKTRLCYSYASTHTALRLLGGGTYDVGYGRAKDVQQFRALVQRGRPVEEDLGAFVDDDEGQVVDAPRFAAGQLPDAVADAFMDGRGIGLVAAPSSGEAGQDGVWSRTRPSVS